MTEVQEVLNSTEPISNMTEAEKALGEAFQKNKTEIKLAPFNRIIVATGATEKQEAIAEVARRFGISTQPTFFPLPPGEERKSGESYSYLLKKRNENPQLYSFDLVLSKLTHIPMDAYPILATDTTVINEKGDILEKPQDKSEAKAGIESMLGSRIKIVTAIGLLANNSNGQKVVIREGVEVLLKTKRLTEDEINAYLESNLDKILQVSSGIDFAGKGQIFIDESEPITVRGIDLGDKVRGESTIGEKEVKIAKSAVDAIETYFIGAPKHPILTMLSLGVK